MNVNIFNLPPAFMPAFNSFVAGAEAIANKEHLPGGRFDILPMVKLEVDTGGKRWVRIWRVDGSSRSAHAFVEIATGDVLKPDSWKRPAKHARGNIYDEHNGLGSMGPYGPAYLR